MFDMHGAGITTVMFGCLSDVPTHPRCNDLILDHPFAYGLKFVVKNVKAPAMQSVHDKIRMYRLGGCTLQAMGSMSVGPSVNMTIHHVMLRLELCVRGNVILICSPCLVSNVCTKLQQYHNICCENNSRI